MKALLIRITAGIVTLGMLLYVLACGPPSGNNQNLSLNQNRPAANFAPKAALKPCDLQSDPRGHAEDVKTRLDAEIAASSLGKLLYSSSNPNGTFDVDVVPVAGMRYVEGYVKGEVGGDDNLKELSDILNNYQDSGSCMRVIYFVPNLQGPSSGGGFEWSSCEYPKHVCPTGECCEDREANANTNTHSNGNSNSNANANRNRNTNN